MTSSSSSPSEAVKVIVRCRPMNSRETAMKCKTIVQLNTSKCSCALLNPNDIAAPPKTFTFDSVYGENSTTEQLYNEIAYPLIEVLECDPRKQRIFLKAIQAFYDGKLFQSVLDGYNSTIFAYGQTGCGKSFSMQGVQEPDCQRGIIPRAFEHIFEAISLTDDYKYLVSASYLEIYNEDIRDLLGPNTKKKLELKEHPDVGVYVGDLSYHPVRNVTECQKLMEQGWRNRAIGATLMNADSSRSHSIFTISVEMMPVSKSLVPRYTTIRRGKLNLVDLAGSERQAKTGATGDRLKEATKINLSLSALGNVISALVDGRAKHIPYRDSKLTRLLQDSLGGNTKTLMVACLSPADNNYDETLSTLRYANRAKNICNQPHINEDPKDTMLREYQEEIQKLRKLLENNNNDSPRDETLSNDRYDEYEKEMQRLRKQYEDEYISKCQMQADLQSLRERYEVEVSNMNERVAQNASSVAVLKEDKRTAINEQKLNSAQKEILKRLQNLQSSMVGGERANDRELKEKRLKKKKAAEQRLNVLAKVMGKVEDEDGPNLMLKVYDDIQDELDAKTDLLRKYKQKVRVLDSEIQDLQYEFESERTDYLETIRRQERQLKLHAQILDNLLPALSNECNYRNIEKIKDEAKWCDESQSWQLPTLLNAKLKFPPATNGYHHCNYNNNVDQEPAPYCGWNFYNDCWSGRSSSSNTSSSPDIYVHRKFSLDQKFQRFDLENFAGNYFKPRRAAELLMQAHEDTNKSINRWKNAIQQNKLHTKFRERESGVFSSPLKSKHVLLNAHHLENNRSRSWTGQASPVTWMTGNVRVSPEMLPSKSTKIDLLPLIREKRGSFERL